eukprot:359937-Chlamydomonas_euryale.AAC.10
MSLRCSTPDARMLRDDAPCACSRHYAGACLRAFVADSARHACVPLLPTTPGTPYWAATAAWGGPCGTRNRLTHSVTAVPGEARDARSPALLRCCLPQPTRAI